MADGVVVHPDHRLVHVRAQLVTTFEGTDLHPEGDDIRTSDRYEAWTSSKNTISANSSLFLVLTAELVNERRPYQIRQHPQILIGVDTRDCHLQLLKQL